MHEMALAESVIGIVERKARAAGAARITAVRLEIGTLGHVTAPAMRFAFAAVAKGSMAEGARLDIERLPGRAWCADCGCEVEIGALGEPCPRCGGFSLRVTGGQEMRVKDMEVT